MDKERIIIYVSDIRKMTGKKKSQSSRIYHDILKRFNKESWQHATIYDVMKYFGMTEEQVREAL